MTFEELNSVVEVKSELEAENQRLKDLRFAASQTVSTLSELPKTKPLESKIERFTALIIESEERIAKLTETFIQRQIELFSRIEALKLPELQKRILSYHFVSCMKLSAVARMLNYSRRYVEMQFNKVLSSLGIKSPNRTAC